MEEELMCGAGDEGGDMEEGEEGGDGADGEAGGEGRRSSHSGWMAGVASQPWWLEVQQRGGERLWAAAKSMGQADPGPPAIHRMPPSWSLAPGF